MIIQVFSEYLQQAQAGNVEFLACPMHPEDKEIFDIKYPLMHKMEDEKIILYCTSCGYKNFPGLALYNNMIDRLISLGSGIEPKK
jgi:hypothetical protein